jgi:quercetin dioxygenase-like cupin family protein
MKTRWMWALLVVLIGVAVYAGTVLATPQSGVTTTILAKSLFDNIKVKAHAVPANVWQARLKTKGLSDVYVVDNKLAPVDPKTGAVQGVTGWHTHPGPSLILVVAGTVTNYKADDPTCTGHSYSAGQGFIDDGSTAHILRNEGSLQAETIAVQLLPKDATRRIDLAQAPGNCPF